MSDSEYRPEDQIFLSGCQEHLGARAVSRNLKQRSTGFTYAKIPIKSVFFKVAIVCKNPIVSSCSEEQDGGFTNDLQR